MPPLTGRVALVTGVSRRAGIGAAICEALARKGADIAFAHFHPADGQFPAAMPEEPGQIADSLRAAGIRVLPVEIDLAAPDAASRLLDQVTARLGDITILVNNAAWSTNDGYADLTADVLDRHYAINVRTAALLSTGFARRFRGHSGGRIINMVSGQDLGAMPGELAYAASKGAMVAFTRSLAAELAEHHITVNAVNPGVTDTGWMTPEIRDSLLAKMPQRRFGTPADAARLVAWLATDEARWITGQVINSEGGYSRA